MICQHDPLYRQNNEAAGGAGCPMCAAERRKAQRPHIVMVAVDTDAKQETVYDQEWFKREVIAKRHGDMTGIGWPLQDMINTAAAANRGAIDDALEAEHDAAEDWRHCLSGD